MMKVTSNPDFIIPNNQIEYGSKLGEGGFGIVYKAVWNYVDVAIKKLMMELSESVMQEFEKEVEVHSKLRNPYIVQIFGITETYGMVMEYMSRGSLRNVLEKNRREEFSWTMRSKIAMDMLIGLSYLHQKHIIHRDLKSLNVLLDDQYKAKLADFGLAKVRSEISSRHSAQSGGAKGTTQWMAPELFELDPEYTPKTDVFSFGIVLWELAAHEYPSKRSIRRRAALCLLASQKLQSICCHDAKQISRTPLSHRKICPETYSQICTKTDKTAERKAAKCKNIQKHLIR